VLLGSPARRTWFQEMGKLGVSDRSSDGEGAGGDKWEETARRSAIDHRLAIVFEPSDDDGLAGVVVEQAPTRRGSTCQ